MNEVVLLARLLATAVLVGSTPPFCRCWVVYSLSAVLRFASYDSIDEINKTLWPKWKTVHNGGNGKRIRMIIGWDDEVWKVQVVDSGDQYMHCEMRSVDTGMLHKVSFIYASNYAQRRREVWSCCVELAKVNTQNPWLVLGDFNAVRFTHERQGGSGRWNAICEELNNCLFEAELEDLKFRGLLYTWNKNCEKFFIRRKLDRSLINSTWLATFPFAEATFPPHTLSAHLPVPTGEIKGNPPDLSY